MQAVFRKLFPATYAADMRDLPPRAVMIRKAGAHKGFNFGLGLLLIIAFPGIALMLPNSMFG